jgi:hypothetical protein
MFIVFQLKQKAALWFKIKNSLNATKTRSPTKFYKELTNNLRHAEILVRLEFKELETTLGLNQ